MDAAISTATLIRYALTTLGIFALIFLLTLLTPWMAKKVDAWIARYRQNHSEEKSETYGVHSIYELPHEKTGKLPNIPQDKENEMLDEVAEEAWKEEKPIVPEVDWFEDAPPNDEGETKRLFPHLDTDGQKQSPTDEEAENEMPESKDFTGDDPLAMRQPAYDEPEEEVQEEQGVPDFMNICGILSGIQEPTYPPEGLEMVTSVFYEEPYPEAPAPKKQLVVPASKPVPVQKPAPVREMPEPMPEISPEPIREHANPEEVNALLGKLIDKKQPEENASFRHWEADPYDEEVEEIDEEDFEYDDDIYDEDDDFEEDEGWFRPAP
ncbi:MAG TPA: hypothetical protein DCO72_08760 [Ruminococcus sp.]|nr:hypothetical protein [Ruminococcus sp.]